MRLFWVTVDGSKEGRKEGRGEFVGHKKCRCPKAEEEREREREVVSLPSLSSPYPPPPLRGLSRGGAVPTGSLQRRWWHRK